MLKILISFIETFTGEIAKHLAGKTTVSRSQVCKDLLRVYVALDELLQKSTVTYQTFETYVNAFDKLRDSTEYRIRIRQEFRDLVNTLKRFEDHLKSAFSTLKLVGGSELSVKLAKVPEASYSLFKKHFVDDLAPKFVADPLAHKYVLRVAVQRGQHELVNVDSMGNISLDLDQLFSNGQLDHEIIDFTDERKTGEVLRDCSDDLVRLSTVTQSLADLIKKNCDLRSIL